MDKNDEMNERPAPPDQPNKELVRIGELVSEITESMNKQIDLFVFDSVREYASKLVVDELNKDFNEEVFQFCLDILEDSEIYVVVELDQRNALSSYDFKSGEFKTGDLGVTVRFLSPEAPLWRGGKPHHHIRRIIR